VRDLLDAAGVAVSLGLLGLVLEGATGPLRLLLAVVFAFFAPGRAVVTNWPRLAHWSEFGMSIVLSLAIVTLLATTALWAHQWHPVGLFEAEAPVTAAALVAGLVRRHRVEPETAADPQPEDRAADPVLPSSPPGGRG